MDVIAKDVVLKIDKIWIENNRKIPKEIVKLHLLYDINHKIFITNIGKEE